MGTITDRAKAMNIEATIEELTSKAIDQWGVTPMIYDVVRMAYLRGRTDGADAVVYIIERSERPKPGDGSHGH